MTDNVRTFVARADRLPDAMHVKPETYERLRELVTRYGWEPMLTAGDDAYRAWLRQGGRRMFGRPADTAEGAVLALIAKVEPMARRGMAA